MVHETKKHTDIDLAQLCDTCSDAEAFQQRGERKKGQEAIPLLQQAAVSMCHSHPRN